MICCDGDWAVYENPAFRPQPKLKSATFLIVRSFSLFFLIFGSLLGQRPQGVEVRGEYRNLAGYAFRVRVPDGLVAYRASSPAPAHGLAIDLGSDDDRISVDGSYNAAEYPTARDALATTVEWISDRAHSIEEPQFQNVTLGGLPAVELVVKYRDKSTKAARVCRTVAAIRRTKPTDTMGIVYEIILDTSAERVAKDIATYDAIVKSFRLDPLAH